MDDVSPIPDVQSPTKSNFLGFISKIKFILIFLILIALLIIIGMKLYPQYFNSLIKSNIIPPQQVLPTPTFVPTAAYVPSTALTTRDKKNFFAGEVVAIDKTSFQVKGDGITLKFTVSGNIYFIETPKILNLPVSELRNTQPKIVDYSSIKKGDLVSVTVEVQGKIMTATGGVIFK